METRRRGAAGGVFWTTEVQEEEVVEEMEEEDFVRQMDENGIIGLEDSLRNTRLVEPEELRSRSAGEDGAAPSPGVREALLPESRGGHGMDHGSGDDEEEEDRRTPRAGEPSLSDVCSEFFIENETFPETDLPGSPWGSDCSEAEVFSEDPSSLRTRRPRTPEAPPAGAVQKTPRAPPGAAEGSRASGARRAVDSRLGFPRGVYTPPRSRAAPPRTSCPERPLVFKSPADIVKEVLLRHDDGRRGDGGGATVPHDFRSPQQAAALLLQLQEDYDKLLTKYAEKENTIDRLRLEAKVNLYSDPPRPGHSLLSGLNGVPSNLLTLDIPRAQRADLQAAPLDPDDGTQRTSTSGPPSRASCSGDLQVGRQLMSVLYSQADRFLQQTQTFEDLLENKKLLASEQKKGLSRLLQGLDSLERGYLLARDDHRDLLLQGADPGSFDPERELEGLIFRCEMKMDGLKEQLGRGQIVSPAPPPAPEPRPQVLAGPLWVDPEGPSGDGGPALKMEDELLHPDPADGVIVTETDGLGGSRGGQASPGEELLRPPASAEEPEAHGEVGRRPADTRRLMEPGHRGSPKVLLPTQRSRRPSRSSWGGRSPPSGGGGSFSFSLVGGGTSEGRSLTSQVGAPRPRRGGFVVPSSSPGTDSGFPGSEGGQQGAPWSRGGEEVHLGSSSTLSCLGEGGAQTRPANHPGPAPRTHHGDPDLNHASSPSHGDHGNHYPSSSSSSSSNTASHHRRGNPLRSPTSCQEASGAFKALQAEVEELREQIERCLRTQKIPASTVPSAPRPRPLAQRPRPLAQRPRPLPKRPRPCTSTPLARSGERWRDGEDPAGGTFSSEASRWSPSARSSSSSAHRPTLVEIRTSEEDSAPRLQVSRCTQTPAEVVPPLGTSCSRRTQSKAAGGSRESTLHCSFCGPPGPCRPGAAGPARSPGCCSPGSSWRTAGNPNPSGSENNVDLSGSQEVREHLGPVPPRSPEEPGGSCGFSAFRRKTVTRGEAEPQGSDRKWNGSFPAAALMESVHVCPPSVLLCPAQPLFLSPSNSRGRPPEVRGHGSRSREGPDLDSSLNRAIRAARRMKATSGHMARSLASGLH